MNIQEFESNYREAMAEALDELQTAVLLLEQIQRKISEVGSSVKHINANVEDFINEQKTE